MDHGILNVPLSKRGNIDAEIDRYKAGEAKAALAARKSRSEQTREDRQEAKRLLATMTDHRAAQLAERCNVTVSAIRASLKSDSHWQPRLVIALLKPAA
jgi:hypothetical protein